MTFKRRDVIEFLRDLGFRYGKKQTKRTQLYKKSGSTIRVWVPKSEQLEALTVKHLLSDAGCSPESAREFFSRKAVAPS